MPILSKLPRWVEVGSFSLACIAGTVNVIGLLGFEHQAVSHMTGISSLLAVSLANFDFALSMRLVMIIGSFVLGAALSGVIIANAVLRLGRRYSLALVCEALLLFAAMLALLKGWGLGHYLASAACGLQNGMMSTYSGAIVRTTHLSGLFTDLGTMLGVRLRGYPISSRQALLYTLLILGFVLGGSVGAYSFQKLEFFALSFPACAALLLALAYWLYCYKKTPVNT